MLKSIYNAGIETSPEEVLKKKMLKESKKKEMENIELPSTEEIDYENFGNKPAMKKSTVDKSVDFPLPFSQTKMVIGCESSKIKSFWNTGTEKGK